MVYEIPPGRRVFYANGCEKRDGNRSFCTCSFAKSRVRASVEDTGGVVFSMFVVLTVVCVCVRVFYTFDDVSG